MKLLITAGPTREALDPLRYLRNRSSGTMGYALAGAAVGVAAETQELVEYGEEKLRRKGCDLLVANDVSRPGIGFDSEENEVILLSPKAAPRPLPRGTKAGIAREIIRVVADLADSHPT